MTRFAILTATALLATTGIANAQYYNSNEPLAKLLETDEAGSSEARTRGLADAIRGMPGPIR